MITRLFRSPLHEHADPAQRVLGVAELEPASEDLARLLADPAPEVRVAAASRCVSLPALVAAWNAEADPGARAVLEGALGRVAAETAGAITLFVTEALKIPVSTTHTITGSIIGVGATKRLSAVRWGVTINLLWAWILTIPVSAVMAMVVYHVVKLFF